MDFDHIDNLEALADRFGVSATMIKHATQIVKQMPDIVPEMMEDKKLTVAKVYRVMILRDGSYNT